MNPLMILKGAKVFLIAGVVLYGLTMVNDYRKDQQNKTDALITANATAVSAEARAQTLVIANAQLEAITSAQSEAIKRSSIAMEESASRFKKIQETQEKQSRLLEGTRLNEAIRNKRGLIVRFSNKATRDRFDEVQDIFNTP
jgi:hypothetical protein